MNGITYYRLKSDYPGDYTKNCALNGTEVDNNFYVLEGRDVKSIAVKDKDIVVTLLNGDSVTAQDVLDFVKPEEIKTSVIKVEFDKFNGVLTLTLADGTIQTVEGFVTTFSVAPSAKTGQFKSVKSLIDVASGGSLPKCGNVVGDRYVTCEDISDYGYLYDYKAVKKIACELKNTGWRIPTKSDWDGMLNAVEPCDYDKTHDSTDRNRVLGKWAGKLLKSRTMWIDCDCECGGCDCGCGCDSCKHQCDCGCDSTCGQDTCFDYNGDSCTDTNESTKSCKCEESCCSGHRGVDAYGFRVTPSGYADDEGKYSYFKQRSAFWTATTTTDCSKAFIKRFQFNKDGVYQDAITGRYHLSLRLVKDYDGKNYYDTEEIMDMEYPTVLLPSTNSGKLIWTSANFACGDSSLSPVLPNNGKTLTYSRHYFINEWNGFKWVRNEMRQGDSVVIEHAPRGKKMVEYRVVGNDFVSVNKMIYHDVVVDVEHTIEKKEKMLIDRIKFVEKVLHDETEDRKTADEKLQDSVDSLVEKTDKTNEDLVVVNNNLVTAVNKINEDIATVNQNLVDAINTINGGIATEIQERKDADEEEREARIAADEALQHQSDERYAELVTKTDKTNEELGKTNQTLTDFATETNKAFGIINEVIKTSVDAINQSIMNETDARIKADEAEKAAREEADAVETAARIAADEAERAAREEADAAETAARIAADEAERAAREEKDKELEDALNKEISDRESADAKEEQERKDNDEEIRGTILTQEGTEFDPDSGVLTLKSKDATNDITVQFSFNFGTFVD